MPDFSSSEAEGIEGINQRDSSHSGINTVHFVKVLYSGEMTISEIILQCSKNCHFFYISSYALSKTAKYYAAFQLFLFDSGIRTVRLCYSTVHCTRQ